MRKHEFALGLLASFAMFNAGIAGEAASGTSITADDFHDYSATEFLQADRDDSGGLSADEFAAMELVKAELANLNGFVRLGENEGLPIASDTNGRAGVDRNEIIANARSNFESAALAGMEISMGQFQDLRDGQFRAADLSHDGKIEKDEILRFSAISLNAVKTPARADLAYC